MSHESIPRIAVTLNAGAVTLPIQLSARRVAQALAIILPSVDARDFAESVEIGPPISRWIFQAWDEPDQDKLQLEAWLVAAMLGELSRGVRQSLEDAALYTGLLALDQAELLPVDFIDTMRAQVAAANTPNLLATVNSAFGSELTFVAEMDGLNRARNCLEHGRGVVRARDCLSGEQTMRLTMPYFAIARVDPQGKLIDIEFGVPLPDDGPHQIVVERRSHIFEFAIGEALVLSRDQIAAFAIGCMLLSSDLAARLPGLAGSKE